MTAQIFFKVILIKTIICIEGKYYTTVLDAACCMQFTTRSQKLNYSPCEHQDIPVAFLLLVLVLKKQQLWHKRTSQFQNKNVGQATYWLGFPESYYGQVPGIQPGTSNESSAKKGYLMKVQDEREGKGIFASSSPQWPSRALLPFQYFMLIYQLSPICSLINMN